MDKVAVVVSAFSTLTNSVALFSVLMLLNKRNNDTDNSSDSCDNGSGCTND